MEVMEMSSILPFASSEQRASLDDICSWHALDELTRSLHLVQRYLEARKPSKFAHKAASASLFQHKSRKRKSPGSDPVTSRDRPSGILTPTASSEFSRATSVVSIGSSSDASEDEPHVYNGVLERKDGRIVAKKVGFTFRALRSTR